MKLTVLGGSAAGGNTGAGCSGYLIEGSGGSLLIDPGPGILQELRRHIDFRTLGGVVISHLHVDHFLDLAALRYAMAYGPNKATRKIPVLACPDGTAFLERVGSALGGPEDGAGFFDLTFTMSDFDPTAPADIAGFRLAFGPVRHAIPAWAMRITDLATGGSLGYTSDTGPSAVLSPLLDGVDVLLAEGTAPEGAPDPGTRIHMTPSEAGRYASDLGAKRLVLTHLWEELGFEAARQAAMTTYDGVVALAVPGLDISW